jgi:chromosome segregation ATPase
MDIEQIENRVEWLDGERLKDKDTISELDERIKKLENVLDKTTESIKALSSDVTQSGVLLSKTEKFETALETHRKDVKKELDAQDKRVKKREQEAKKSLRLELDSINKSVKEMQASVESVEKLSADFKDESRFAKVEKQFKEITDLIEQVRKEREEHKRIVQSNEETQKHDAKRLADMQGELTTFRKRSDEFRAELELALENQKKIDARLNELLASEAERREVQNEFIDKQTAAYDERESIWRDWSKRFTVVEDQSKNLATHLQKVTDAERAVKRAQETFEEITDQINRRINEITEVQRLGEERFRQEWSTFKSDDQKRWTNYTLTQEELQRENSRRVERLADQTSNLEDGIQEIQDIVQHLSDQSDKLLQSLLANLRDWVAQNERFFGSVK